MRVWELVTTEGTTRTFLESDGAACHIDAGTVLFLRKDSLQNPDGPILIAAFGPNGWRRLVENNDTA